MRDEQKLDNPSAFPWPTVWSPNGQFRETGHVGMSLRDWFATHAPPPDGEVIMSQRTIDHRRNPHNDAYKPHLRSDDEIKAYLAYRYADAMLTERMKVKSDDR